MGKARAVPFDHYTRVLRLARPLTLELKLLQWSTKKLGRFETFLKKSDRQFPGEVLVFLDQENVPFPNTVQRLYGWRYFNALNYILEQLDIELQYRDTAALLYE